MSPMNLRRITPLVELFFLAAATFLQTVLTGCEQRSGTATPVSTSPSPPSVTLGAVVGLTTHWYPDRAQNDDETENKLVRELVRQGVLMAVREELGLVTRDETLEEPLSNATTKTRDTDNDAESQAEPLALSLNLDAGGSWEARLYGAGTTQDNAVWQHQGTSEMNKRTIYCQFAKQMDEQCAAIAEKLRQAGAAGDTPKLNPDNKPTSEIEQQLELMNFASQFAAVRTAHLAMHNGGPSIAWMGVLVRGYANLAMLTQHTWSTHYEAFAARSLLYAERMCRLSNADALARWHRAYARAIIGAHSAAIDELEGLAGAGDQDDDMPPWTLLVEPYVRFDRAKLPQIAKDHPELTQTAALLSWNQCHCYMHGRWIYEQGIATAQVCPEAYGVYSVMANWNALGTKRTGSAMGTRAFGELLPQRVLTLKNLPPLGLTLHDTLRDVVQRLLGSEHERVLSDRPISIAQALKIASASEPTPSECSWAILAGLIAEEQFVEAADMLHVSGDATEHSDAWLVEELTPLVAGHRYAAYIRSFVAPPNDPEQAAEILRDMTVVDPRARMRPLFNRIWHTPTADGKNGNQLQWRAIWERDAALPDLRDTYYGLSVSWTQAITPEHRQRFAQDFRDVSPDAPNALRLQWETVPKLTAADLAKFEPQLKDDPVGWMTLGSYYYRLNDLDSSERCFKRSLEISPCYDATVGLANT